MPYPGTMTTLLAAARIAAASSAVALRTGRASCPAAAVTCSCPNAPKSTLVNERFMAFDMLTDRMKPDAPSSAPATISSLLLSTKPIAAADRDDHQHAKYQRNDNHCRKQVHLVGMEGEIDGDCDRDPQETQVHDVLSLIGDGPLRQDLLQFARRHQTAGNGQRAQNDLERQH